MSDAIKTIQELEVELMQNVLKYYNGNVSIACRAAGMSRANFYRKMKIHGINKKGEYVGAN